MQRGVWRSTTSILLALCALTALWACSRTDSNTGPSVSLVHSRSNYIAIIVADPCYTDPNVDCWPTPEDITFTLPDIEVGGGGEPIDMTCPQGCTTYPLQGGRLFQFNKALALIDSLNGPNCGWVSGYLRQLQSSSRIRVYVTLDGNDGVTEWHPNGTGPDYTARIYLYAPTIDWDFRNFANTLAHEAYHGYNRTGDETGATNFAQSCVPI